MMLIVAAVMIGLFSLNVEISHIYPGDATELIARGEVNLNDTLDIEYERPDDVL